MLIRYILALSLILNPFSFAIPAERIIQADKIEGIVHQKDFVGSKGHFEKNVAGVSAYADLAGTSPVDGSGGSPNTSCTRTTSSPISGDGSLLITKSSGASRQGEGCGMAFSTDTNHYGRVLTISADYIVSSGTFTAGSSSTDSDITVWLYDVTNAVIIQPSNYKFFSSSTTLSDKFIGQFQTASNSTSYRLIFHIGTTDTDALVLKLDNISVSPQGTTLAPVITDWKSYTPTISTGSGTMTNYAASGLYSRNGDSINISGTISFSGAVGTWTNPSFSLPSGLSVDESKLANQYLQIIGTVTFLDFGVTTYKGVVRYAKSSNTLEIMYLATVTNDAGSATDPAFYTGASSTAPFSMASGDEISFTVSNLPILGWSSGLEIGDNYSGREIAARYSSAVGTATTNGTLIPFDTKDYDKTSSVTTGASWKFTAPTYGIYTVGAMFDTTAAANTVGEYLGYLLYKNGSSTGKYVALMYVQTTSSISYSAKGSVDIELNAGDYIDVRTAEGLTNVPSLSGTAGLNYIEVKKKSSPAAIASGEKVAARYTTNAGQSITNGTTPIVVDFEDASISTHGIVTTGASWKFTAQTSGVYKVKASVMFSTAAWTQGYSHVVALHKNGTAYSRSYNVLPYTGSYYPSAIKHEDEIQLNAGDYIDIRALHDETTARTLFTSDLYNYISITKL